MAPTCHPAPSPSSLPAFLINPPPSSYGRVTTIDALPASFPVFRIT